MNKRTALEILVFATNIFSTEQINKVLEKLLTHPGVKQANFDLEDIDKILRVVSCGITEREVEEVLQNQNIHCLALA
ncbi:hypothetical protein OSR52_13780 [Galbibacter sp. CMA-7]|uniref:Uncharacterized protein n=2 Tax=Galbibacter pacificus TaxID=2996052 RepID=A0ABT6FUK1_9FLAO|nr:hypothetical protein [Galbibacter pacificus]MDG3583584.1 hypothetical protein [Galbibacter pacificus]MDG3586940.1 hypothetical protein [Galbibacter pacificus]